MGVHHLLAKNHRQELVEGDVLDQGGVDVPCLLIIGIMSLEYINAFKQQY